VTSHPKYRLYYADGSYFQDEDGRTEFGPRRCLAIQRRISGLSQIQWPPIGPAWLLVRVTAEEADAILSDDSAAFRVGWDEFISPEDIIQITPEHTGAFEIEDSKFKDFNGKKHDVLYRTSPGYANVFALTDAELDDLAIAVLRRISEREFYQDTRADPTADPGKPS
jgi:hypothetical protein